MQQIEKSTQEIRTPRRDSNRQKVRMIFFVKLPRLPSKREDRQA